MRVITQQAVRITAVKHFTQGLGTHLLDLMVKVLYLAAAASNLIAVSVLKYLAVSVHFKFIAPLKLCCCGRQFTPRQMITAALRQCNALTLGLALWQGYLVEDKVLGSRIAL